MQVFRQRRWYLLVIGLAIVLAMLATGCGSKKISSSDPTSKPSAEKDEGPTPLYYDFGDVLLPSELKLLKKGSFVFRAPGFSAGVLSLKGRVEINSLIKFFDTNMAKDNWKLVSSFKSQRTIMLFNKENRWCVINITEEDYYTYTEIWVSPTTGSGEAESGLLK